MKIFHLTAAIGLALLLNTGCRGGGEGSGQDRTDENTSAQDTGFTGLKKFRSGGHVVLEETYKNGIREGIATTYYESGNVKGTSLYVNGLRQDSSKWFYHEGQLFRSTPFKNDTVDGIQKQYYRNGRLKARIGYSKGLRTFEFEEFDLNGKKYTGYPDLVVNTRDDYSTKGTFSLSVSTTDKSARVKYYRGDFGQGVFDSTKAERIKVIDGNGIIELKKTGTPQPSSFDILASILSPYGNSYLVSKKVNLPYNDLK